MGVDILKAAKQDWYDYHEIHPFIIQVGTGGTGSYLVQHIAQMLSITGKPAHYILCDADRIEEKNLKNQMFLAEEVGLKKADVLASRYSEAYGIEIQSYTDSYIESVEDFKKIMVVDYQQVPRNYSNVLLLPIIIGCVDNIFTRKIMDLAFHSLKNCIYIDAGNESTIVPKDWRTRWKEDWTDEELKAFNDSGWSGQVVTGVRLNLFKQSPLMDAFPELLSDNETAIRPSDLSCTELAASEPQRLIVNKFAALTIANTLTHIIEDKEISSHITFFHSKKSYIRSTPSISQTEYLNN